MRILAIIPARAGSERLKKKNRLKLGGKPLINWTIDFVSKLKIIKDIVLSTDDKKIINENKNSKKIKIFERPNKLRGKNVKTISVILDILKKYEKKFNKVDTILLFQATSPFRSKNKINFALKKFKHFKMKKSIVSVSSLKKNNCKRKFIIKDNMLLETKKKNNMKKYVINGNFYIANKIFLKKYRTFFWNKKTHPIILKGEKYRVDIDTKKDFIFAKNFIN